MAISGETDPGCDAAWGTVGKNNFLMLVLDGILFFAAIAFIEPNTVLPAFVGSLTDSGIVIGLVTAVRNGGWLLPQLFAANYIEQQPLKKPIMLRFGIVSRLAIIALALIICSGGIFTPPAALAVFFLLYLAFNICEGVSTVAWIDIVAKTLPASKRGALFSAMQFFGNLLGLGAGLVVRSVLGNRNIFFPRNYGILFSLAAAVYSIEYVALYRLQEFPATTAVLKRSLTNYFRGMPQLLRNNPNFSRLAVIRIFIGSSGLLLPFYVVYGQKMLQLQPEIIGSFVLLQTAGNSLGSVALGWLSDRRGNRRVIQYTAAFTLLAPVLALLALLAAAIIPLPLPIYVYAAVFAVIGISYSGVMIGFTNYLLEMADESERPSYYGLLNFINASTMFLPLLGGAVIGAASFYTALLLGICLAAAGFGLSFGMAEPREIRQPRQDALPGSYN